MVSARFGDAPEHERLDGVEVERVSPGAGSRWAKMGTYLAGMLARTARWRGEVDVIQVQQALYPAAAMALVAPLLRRPLVVRNAGSGVAGAVGTMGRLPLGSFGLHLIARAATCVSLSDEMTGEMERAGFRRLVCIPNAAVLPAPTSAAARAEARAALGVSGRVVLFVGRLEAEKGVDLLLSAWRRLDVPATLLVVGDGPERSRLEALASNTVRFCGMVRDVSRHLQAADLFALPSPSEGLSNALLEAMAAGLPAVATEVGGNRQVIARPELGLLVPPGDPDAFATALRTLIVDEPKAAAMGVAARDHVAARFSVATMVDAYERLYRELM